MRGARDLWILFGAGALVAGLILASTQLRPPTPPSPPRLDPVEARVLAANGISVYAPDDPTLPPFVVTARRWGLPALLAEPFTTWTPVKPTHDLARTTAQAGDRPGPGAGTATLAYVAGTPRAAPGARVLCWIVVSRMLRPKAGVPDELVTLVDARTGSLVGHYSMPRVPSA